MNSTLMTFRLILGLSAVLVVACSGGSASVPPVSEAPSPAPSTAGVAPSVAALSPSASASPVAVVLVGGDRPVGVHIPAGYDPAKPAPLLILLHGYGSSGPDHETYLHLGRLAEERGFLYAYPDGTFNSSGDRFWEGTDACCDFERSGVDDSAYLAGLIAEIQKSFAVDPKRIDLIGHSNGGFMSYRMSCERADLIAAMVSLAGATFADPAKCAPTDPVAVLQIHGTADDTIAFKGGTIDGLRPGESTAPYPGAITSVATWATYDGCKTSSVVDEHVDVDADVTVNGAQAEATVTRWTGCRRGGAAELWTVPGGSHSPDISDAFPKAVLDFLEAHPKP